MYKPEGVISSLVTPFNEDETIMEEGVRELISFQIQNGVAGVSVAPNTGEFVNLTLEDIKRLIRIAMDEIKGRLPLIVGALSPTLQMNIEVAKLAKEHRVDAILVTPPYYMRASNDGLFEWFKRIGSIGVPMIIFNHPFRTPYNIMPDMIELLLKIDTFVGIKEVDPSMVNNSKRLAAINNRISYLMGEEVLALYHTMQGGHGGFFALSNIAPKMMLDLYNETKAGNFETAKKLHLDVIELADAVYIEDYPATLKAGLKLIGLKGGRTRAPLYGLKESNKERLIQVMKKLKLL